MLVVSGRQSVRHPDGVDEFAPWDVLCFARGPGNDSGARARVLMWSTVVVPTATVHPDSDEIEIWTGRKHDDVKVRRTSAVECCDGEAPAR